MEKTIGIESEGEGVFPQLSIEHVIGTNSVDLKIAGHAGEEIGTVAVDYFEGRVRVFVWMPEDNEPRATVHIHDFNKAQTQDAEMH